MPWIPVTQENVVSGAMTLLYDNLAGGTIASWDVTGISGAYTQLFIIASVRVDNAGAVALWIRYNNDSGSNYSWQQTFSTAVTNGASEGIAVAQGQWGRAPGTSAPANSFATCTMDLAGYSDATKAKAAVSRAISREGTGSGTVVCEEHGHVWFASPAAITRITVIPSAGNFVAGSRLSIYGLL